MSIINADSITLEPISTRRELADEFYEIVFRNEANDKAHLAVRLGDQPLPNYFEFLDWEFGLACAGSEARTFPQGSALVAAAVEEVFLSVLL